MEVKIKSNNELIDATIEMVNGVMVVTPMNKLLEPENGDIVATRNGHHLFLVKDYIGGNIIYAHIGYDLINDSPFESGAWNANRLATEKEKKLLFDKIDELGHEWLPEEKKLVKKKWKPMAGQGYYIPAICNAQFKAVKEDWSDDVMDVLYFNKGWIFRTEEECQAFCGKLNQAINQVKP